MLCVHLFISHAHMRYIEPVYDSYWDDIAEEFVHTDTIVAYQVISDTGTVLGEGETREEALTSANDRDLLFV